MIFLSGRTLDFTVDLSKTAVIGRRYLNPDIYGASAVEETSSTPSNQSSLSRKGSSFTEADTCWKKAANSQVCNYAKNNCALKLQLCLPLMFGEACLGKEYKLSSNCS